MFFERKEVGTIVKQIINEPFVKDLVDKIRKNNRDRYEAELVIWQIDKLIKKFPLKETF